MLHYNIRPTVAKRPEFSRVSRKSLMRWRSEKCNNRQYDARTQLFSDGGGGAVAGGDEREAVTRPVTAACCC